MKQRQFFLLFILFGFTMHGSLVIAQSCAGTWADDSVFSSLDREANCATTWDPDGDGPQAPLLIVGGGFERAGGLGANHIAAWDGVAWHALDEGLNGEVRALCVYRGQLIAGGVFTVTANGASNSVALWTGQHWQPLGNSIACAVGAMTVYDGRLIASGIRCPSNVSCAIWGWDGAEWSMVAPEMAQNSPYISSMTVWRGKLVVGGRFAQAGSIFSRNLATWDGERWQDLDADGNGDNVSVGALCVWRDQLIVGGTFNSISGVPVSNVASWNGTAWSAMGGQTVGWVSDLFPWGDEVVATGLFSSIGGRTAESIGAWNGTFWRPLGTGLQSWGYGLATHEGRLFAVGGFTGPNVARINVWSEQRPKIDIEPNDAQRCVNGAVALRTRAVGVAPLSFQWRKNGLPLTDSSGVQGSETSELTLEGAAGEVRGTYQCIVSNQCGETRTRTAVVTACLADLNCDGANTVSDVFAYLDAFFSGHARADTNQDGAVTVQDVFDFLSAYFGPCV